MNFPQEELFTTLFDCISPEHLDAIAKETGFIQRKRKISARDFIELLFQMHGDLSTCTLQELATNFTLTNQKIISRNAVDKKFTHEAVLFLKRVIEAIMTHLSTIHRCLPPHFFNLPFSCFRVIDATYVAVPDHLKNRAKRTGQLSYKVHFEFDLLTGKALFLHVDYRALSDTKAGELRLPFIEEKDLCVQDLGYLHFKSLQEIQRKEAYFISKIRADTFLAFKNPFPQYKSNGELNQSSVYQRIDLVALTKKLRPGEYLELEEVYFGQEAHLQARCIIYRQEEAAVAQRLKRIDRRTTKSQKIPKAIVRKLANITVYMTNLPPTVDAKQVIELYRFRWQIELTFKAWKSMLDLVEFKLMKSERWQCHIYATILVAILSQFISYQIRNDLIRERNIEISETVSMRVIANQILPQLFSVMTKEKVFKELIQLTFDLLLTTAKKSRTKKGTVFKHL